VTRLRFFDFYDLCRISYMLTATQPETWTQTSEAQTTAYFFLVSSYRTLQRHVNTHILALASCGGS
jgi:hypothetical protein